MYFAYTTTQLYSYIADLMGHLVITFSVFTLAAIVALLVIVLRGRSKQQQPDQGLGSCQREIPLREFEACIEATAEVERIAARKQFLRDVKKHVDAIAKKYILPDEGTYNFALMYVPAENVYYETIIKEDAGEDRQLFSAEIITAALPN